MPLIDITKPEIIKFLNESYEKTAKLRMRWNDANEDKLKLTATFRGPEKGYTEQKVAKSTVEIGMFATTRDYISSGPNRFRKPYRDAITVPRVADLKKGHSISDVGLGDPKDDPRLAKQDTDTSLDPVMRPVPPQQKRIIYDDIPDFGRLEYLKVRNRIKPEDKYYFSETMGSVYGWRLKDSYFGRQAPMYGRVAKMSKGLQCRSGPQPDPQDPCDL